MLIDHPLFILTIIVGPVFMITGLVLHQFPPREINFIYGYRTRNSMRSMERWRYAQKYAAGIITGIGVMYLLAGLGLCSSELDIMNALIVGLLLLLGLCSSIYWIVERKLKQKFG
jgi:uncharacterized membrane protein